MNLKTKYETYDRHMHEAYNARKPCYPENPSEHEYSGRILYLMRESFRDKNVLEIACGGGNWTRHLSDAAKTIVAVDISQRRIEFANAKNKAANVKFVVGSAYELEAVTGTFSGAFAAAWFSHVPQTRYQEFLDGLHRRIGGQGAHVFLIDERENDRKAYRKNEESDWYKKGKLPSGETFEIVDNVFSLSDYERIFSPYASELTTHIGPVFTWVHYLVK
jgi:ubiquinone/menaquinone biosynthesis C-methylase UbiE